MDKKKDFRVYLFTGLAAFFVLVFVVVAVINGITARRSDEILKESVEGHLISSAAAADDHISGADIKDFRPKTGRSELLTQDAGYQSILSTLRATAKSMSVTNIYVIYKIGANWYFVMDTDEDPDDPTFCGDPYPLDSANAEIFNDVWAGKDVDVVRLKDEWGVYRTYAIPLTDPAETENGGIVAVLAIDIEDSTFIKQTNMRLVNNIILYVTLAALFVFMFFVVKYMTDKNAAIGKQLEIQEERYKTAVSSASDAIFDYSIPAGSVYLGRQLFGMLDMPLLEKDGAEMPIEEFYTLLGETNAKKLRGETYRMAAKEIDSFEIEFEIPKAGGGAWINLRGKAHFDKSGVFNRASGAISEITERKRLQAEIHTMAYYDKLTRIPNRAFLFQTLNELVTRQHDKFALYFIDLDNFKQVNDNFGHEAGDNMLRHFAEFMKKTMGDGNMAYRPAAGSMDIAARFGGDEFVVINTTAKDITAAVAFAEKMLKSFNTSGESALARQYNVSMSIGVAFFPLHAGDAESLIKCADIAMYHAKKLGKNSVKAYNPNLKED